MKNKLKIVAYLLSMGLTFSNVNVNATEVNANNTIENNMEEIKYLKTKFASNIRKNASLNSEVFEVASGNTIINNYVLEGDWYRIMYKEQELFIHSSCVDEISDYIFKCEPLKRGYLNNDKNIITINNDYKAIPKYEFVEVYEEYDNMYLIKTNEFVGYIDKKDFILLEGTYVVVDISNQELRLYDNNKLILISPIVSGLPTKSRESDIGAFEIYSITNNRYLVGPNYKSYVDVMMSYNRGEGLHDAEYHTNADGFKHGWRNINEFGGNTYLKNGSHGCINMPHDKALEVYEHVNIGTKVLVKK